MPLIRSYLACFSLLLASCSQADFPAVQVNASHLKLNAGQGLVYYMGKPFSGTSVARYANGRNSITIDYDLGKKDGKHLKWFDDGTLSYEAHYKTGKLHGAVKTWWRSGTLRSQGNYSLGKVDGTQRQWYKSGALFKQLNYTMGLQEGMQKAWRQNGKIYNNYEAKNGRIFGLKRANLCYQLEDEIVQLND